MMNETAVPWPATTRSTMPTATVPSQAATPDGTRAAGRRHPRATSQPTASPARNGQAVLATPGMVSPSWWLARPMTTNTSTAATSRTAARIAVRENLTP